MVAIWGEYQRRATVLDRERKQLLGLTIRDARLCPEARSSPAFNALELAATIGSS